MTDVVIAGIGQIPVGEHWDLSLRSMAVKAILASRKECPDLEPESMFIGNSMGSVASINLFLYLAETPMKVGGLHLRRKRNKFPLLALNGDFFYSINTPILFLVQV
jgi:hypothetical protein